MSAPKIKLYRLKRDFVVDNLDLDRRTEENDELLPVKDKFIVPQDIMDNRKLKGIIPFTGKFCEKLARISPIGEIHGTLSLEENEESNSESYSDSGSESVSVSTPSSNSGIYNITPDEPVGIDPVLTDGCYPRVMIDTEIVPRSGYEYSAGQIIAAEQYKDVIFTDVYFVNHAAENLSVDSFSCQKTPVYDGRNSFFKPFLFTLKDGVQEVYKNVDGYQVLDNYVTDFDFLTKASSELLSDGDWYINIEKGEISLSESTDKEVFLSYVAESSYSRRYIAEHFNWVPENEQDEIGGHLYMGPDVFVGMKRYEPNSYEDPQTGQVVNIGTIPCFVDSGTYSLSHREGSVTFAGAFNNSDEENVAENAGSSGNVHVSYANICGVENVSEQIFELEYTYDDVYGSNSGSESGSESELVVDDPIENLREGDAVFKPSLSDKRYLKSIGAMWVSRHNRFMPRNVYITHDKNNNGSVERVTELKPVIVTIDPYDQLTVKTG